MTNAPEAPAWLVPSEAGFDSLPHPTRERWQPLRLGLVDLFYYDDEQFWFHDGRLLLRGNNGTGKSKVLALTLPFLLDGSIQPRRIEPDADPKKRMEWNLLMGGAHPGTERTGYSWVEFGRLDQNGTEHFTTLGIGLKAAAGRGIVKTWYFVCDRRIGDLHLVDETRTVLTQERLRAELDRTASGHVHTTQEAYRRAVDEALFRLGDERYTALIELLIQLRQPQLSKRPDEKVLSAALTEALAPLDQAVVADVAESFRSLEEERAGIADARDTLASAEEFLKHYRAYAAVAARRHTTEVRVANSRFEHAGRDLRETETTLAEAATSVEQILEAEALAEEQHGQLTGRREAMRASPEMRDAARLDAAETAATDLATRETQAGAEVTDVRAASERARAEQQHALDRDEQAREDAGRCAVIAARRADEAGLGADHLASTGAAEVARATVARRREQVALVRRLVAVAETARQRVEQQQRGLDRADTVASGRAEDARLAGESVADAVSRYRDLVGDYLSGLRTITPEPGAEELTALAEVWARSLDGESPVRGAVVVAAGSATAEVERGRAAAEHRAGTLGSELLETRNQIAALESGHDPEPAPAPGRDPSIRLGAPGAPLWRVTDFDGSLTEAERAGLEAALQSAGVLDAWLFPDGTLVADGDVVLAASGAPVPARRSLSTALVASVGPDAGVSEQVVSDVLSRVGLGEESGAALWVEVDGRWGAGPARGAWDKKRAEFIGAGARESSRRALLARLRLDGERLESGVAAARRQIEEAEQQVRRITGEQDRYPGAAERGLVTVHERSAAAQRELDRARAEVDRARTAWEGATIQAEESLAELSDTAGDLGLGTTSAELDLVIDAITAYAEALAELRSAVRAASEASTALATATARADEAIAVLEARTLTHRDLRARAATQRALADALRETVGASVAELQAKLEAVSSELARVGEARKRLARDQLMATGLHATLQERERDLSARRDEAAEARAAVVRTLRSFTATGVLRVALPDLVAPDPAVVEDWNITAAVGLARNAEQRLEGTDESDDAWVRAQQRMSTAHTELAAQMSRHGHTAVIEQHGDVMVARVRYLTDEADIDQLAVRLAADLADRERLLSAREREILENHLVNEVAGHVHELLLSAQGQIDRMNAELVERKTSTGMQLRVLWRERPDGPTGLRAARELMLRADATWTPEDRTAIGVFLQARIAEVREADPSGSWQEHLELALDYRQWHTFAVERRQNGQWSSAAGPASGGERVLAMSVPLFAAASSHYNSAGPHAPRLILLDEAFAGVDDDSRAKSLGLLATFDLDVVMTSEREWGCYPQVPGLSIAQLSRVDGVDAVGITRWRWDGRRRTRDADVDAAARASDSTPDPEAGLYDGTLLG